jgi:hypothetical protein
MATYKVQQMAQVWYEIEVEAANREEAIELASTKIMNDEGTAADGSWYWQDEFWTDKDEMENN